MKIEVRQENKVYELNILQITQLCGRDIRKKCYLLESLCKYFSNSRYAVYEMEMQNNILLDGEKVGRNYFSTYFIRSRSDLIGMIKLTKNSLMMKYLTERLTDFDCQKELDIIAEHLEKIYLEMNLALTTSFHNNIEIAYEQKSLLEMIQNSTILGKEERELEQLSNIELIETCIDLFWKIQEQGAEKSLIIFENIDYFLSYEEYVMLYEKMRKFCDRFDVWFLVSTSMEGFVVLEEEYLRGINIVNDIIFDLPEKEEIVSFVMQHYPYHKQTEASEILRSLQKVIQNIGLNDYSLDLQSQVLLKMINESLCMRCGEKIGVNSIENSFIVEENVV